MNNEPLSKENTILKIFNYVGGTLIFLGVSYFIMSNWEHLNNFIKIFSSLGAAIIAFIIAMLLHTYKKYDSASSAFYMLAGLLLPIGLGVTIDIVHPSLNMETYHFLIATICFTVFLIAQLFFQRTILLIFTIIFASYFYISLIDFILSKASAVYPYVANYELITVGMGYILLGYYFNAKKINELLIGPLYFFGALFILSQSFLLSNHFFYTNNVLLQWQILTPIFILLAFILSVPLKSKSFLYLGAIFLLLYISDITNQFVKIFGEMGWSLFLILMGLLLMAIGYAVMFIRRKINKS